MADVSFEALARHARTLNDARIRLESATGGIPWTALIGDRIDPSKHLELEAALGQASDALRTVVSDRELWHELWSLPKRLDKDGRRAAENDYVTFYETFRGVSLIVGGAPSPWIGQFDQRRRVDADQAAQLNGDKIEELREELATWIAQAGAAIEQSDLAALVHISHDGKSHLMFAANVVITGAAAAAGTFGGPPGAAAGAVGATVLAGLAEWGISKARARHDRNERIEAVEHALDTRGRELVARLDAFTTRAELLAEVLVLGRDVNSGSLATVDELVDELQRAGEILGRNVESIAFGEEFEANIDGDRGIDGGRTDPARVREVIEALTATVARLDSVNDASAAERVEVAGRVRDLFAQLAYILAD